MFEEKSSGAGSKRLLAGVAVVVVLVTGGWLYAKYIPAEMAYRGLRDAGFCAYNFESFVGDYSKSHRLSDVDGLLYRQVTQQFEDTYRWRLYKNLFPSGRHAAELEKRLSDRKMSELAALKERVEPERASLFLQWFYDTPEGVKCRELLRDHLERTGAGNRCSPPGGCVPPAAAGAPLGQDRVFANRVHLAGCPFPRSARVAGNDLKVQSLTVRSAVSIHLPGEPKPAWTQYGSLRLGIRILRATICGADIPRPRRCDQSGTQAVPRVGRFSSKCSLKGIAGCWPTCRS